MDNEEIIIVDRINENGEKTTIEYHFKLKSQSIVELEKMFGKNIFEIFESLSFTSIQTILHKCLIQPKGTDANTMMDDVLTKYSLLELGGNVLKNIAVKSGLLKKNDVENEAKETLDPNL